MINIKAAGVDGELTYKSFLFPSGEVGVKLDVIPKFFVDASRIKLLARINSSKDFIELAMVKDAIEREYRERYNDLDMPLIDVFIPKFPYAQQDRICNKGESLSVEVFARLVNSLNFNTVTILDPHSNVTPPLINRVKVITQLQLINRFHAFMNRVQSGNNVFLDPDFGARKKIEDIVKFFDRTEYIVGEKQRNLSTGEIIKTVVHCGDLGGKDVIICDDICLGGATFIEIAKVLKTKNVGKIVLFVTHGVFNKGVDHIFSGGIDEIWTTNSYDIDQVGTTCYDVSGLLF